MSPYLPIALKRLINLVVKPQSVVEVVMHAAQSTICDCTATAAVPAIQEVCESAFKAAEEQNGSDVA